MEKKSNIKLGGFSKRCTRLSQQTEEQNAKVSKLQIALNVFTMLKEREDLAIIARTEETRHFHG